MPKGRMALLLAVPALALGACGGDSDEDEIKAIIEDGAENPSSICDNATKRVLDQLGGSEESCKKAAEGEEGSDKPDDIDVEVDGEKATAKFKDEDGDNTVRFVKEGDTWKVDAVE
ncbi:MAG TPA: hypothetical protein VHF89_12535 [Solirubrobacteraceae bacterium]|nr:hypothetical protein [Solirubrobacteraceae bacterium]